MITGADISAAVVHHLQLLSNEESPKTHAFFKINT
jgi:hypothetical protein